jgi:putative transcriptional regulator
MKNTIKVQRAIHDLTQEELAAKVDVTRQTINALEAGRYIPSGVLVLKIARVFGQRVEDIFSLEDND